MATVKDLERHVRPQCIQACPKILRLIAIHLQADERIEVLQDVLDSADVIQSAIDARTIVGLAPLSPLQELQYKQVDPAALSLTLSGIIQSLHKNRQDALVNAGIVGYSCSYGPFDDIEAQVCTSPNKDLVSLS